MLFPLPLTPFENYMLADDRDEFPMSFFLRLHFWGSLDRDSFETAVKRTVVRHPLLRAFVQAVDGELAWVRAEGCRTEIAWNTSTQGCDESASRIDLTKATGLRITVTQADEQATVLFEFHHACTDGMGAVQFIEDLLTTYTAEHSGTHLCNRLRPLDPTKLRDRGTHGLNAFGRILRLPLDMLASFGIAQFFCNRPSAIEAPARPRLANDHNGTGPASVSERFTAEQLNALKAAAKRERVTVNDLLVRDLLLAIDGWNAEHNSDACGSCLRISVPVNLRQKEDAGLPATNVVSMVFVDRRVKARTNPRTLLTSIRIDTWFIKRFRLALVFTWIIGMFHSIKGGFGWLLGGEGALATAVLSNLGVQFDDLPLAYLGDRAIVGDAVLEKIDFLPPIRRKTHAALGVVTYAGELMISLQYDARSLTAAMADDLLAMFRSQLATSAGLLTTTAVPTPVEAQRPLEAA